MAPTESINVIENVAAEAPSRPCARDMLRRGVAIPAHPLALTADRRLDERRQRALSRYYLESGAGGLAVGVHTTQFEIHDPRTGLLAPVLALALEEIDRFQQRVPTPVVRVAGVCGNTRQAVEEAVLARDLGYQFALVSPAGLGGKSLESLLDHFRAIAEVIDVFGFYLQPSVGGISLPMEFWRRLCEIEHLAAIKVAAFDRYKTLDVVRAVAESGRRDIALYTGNDDNIVLDLIADNRIEVDGVVRTPRFVGGLLGQWAVWTSSAVGLLRRCQRTARGDNDELPALLRVATELTDANSAIFDVRNGFRGCIPGIHEVLRRQGLLQGIWCLNDQETLSPGQASEIERVTRAYPHLQDNPFVAANRDRWLSG